MYRIPRYSIECLIQYIAGIVSDFILQEGVRENEFNMKLQRILHCIIFARALFKITFNVVMEIVRNLATFCSEESFEIVNCGVNLCIQIYKQLHLTMRDHQIYN